MGSPRRILPKSHALMLNKRLNPFAAVLALTIIASVGTLFVVHKIFETDFTYAAYGTPNSF